MSEHVICNINFISIRQGHLVVCEHFSTSMFSYESLQWALGLKETRVSTLNRNTLRIISTEL